MTIKTDKINQNFQPQCPNCQRILDGFTSLSGKTPKPGDVTVCVYCNATLEFIYILGNLDLKPVTADALVETDFVELGRCHDIVNRYIRKNNNG